MTSRPAKILRKLLFPPPHTGCHYLRSLLFLIILVKMFKYLHYLKAICNTLANNKKIGNLSLNLIFDTTSLCRLKSLNL